MAALNLKRARRHTNRVTADAGPGDFVVLDVHAQMDVGWSFHLHALLYQQWVVAIRQAIEMVDRAGKAAAAEPVAGSSAIPISGGNMRAWNFAHD